MRIQVLSSPGGPGMEAERILALLRKKVVRLKLPGPTPILEVPNLNSRDLQELHRNKYKVIVL